MYQYIVYYKMRKSKEKKNIFWNKRMVRLSYIVHKTLGWLHNLKRICIVRIVFLQGEGYTSIVQFYQIGSFQ